MGNPHSRRRLCFDRRADETGCGGASAQGYARRVRARCRNSLIRCITRLLTVTQEITRAWCRKVCTVLCASVCSSVRRTRVRCRKGSAHALPAWRHARSEPDLRKAAREAARRAQGCAKRRRRKCARAAMRLIMWNVKIYHSPGERAFLLQKNNTLYEDYTKITEKLLENDKSTQKNIAIQNKRRYTVLKRV